MKAIFAKIQDRNDALEIIKYTALFNLLFGCLTVLWAFTNDKKYLMDALAFFLFGYLVWMRHSRTAALLLMYFPVFDILYFLKCKITNVPYQYDSWWLIVYIFLIWFDIRGVEATLKLHGRLACEKGNENEKIT
jgi:hypothetical protein